MNGCDQTSLAHWGRKKNDFFCRFFTRTSPLCLSIGLRQIKGIVWNATPDLGCVFFFQLGSPKFCALTKSPQGFQEEKHKKATFFCKQKGIFAQKNCLFWTNEDLISIVLIFFRGKMAIGDFWTKKSLLLLTKFCSKHVVGYFEKDLYYLPFYFGSDWRMWQGREIGSIFSEEKNQKNPKTKQKSCKKVFPQELSSSRWL